MPYGKTVDSLVEDVQLHLSPLHLHHERDGYKTVLWRLAALAEQDMGHLPIVPVDNDAGYPACGATLAGQDDHVPLDFDRPVAGMNWANEAGDKQLGITVVLVAAISGGNLHGMVLLGLTVTSQRRGQASTMLPFPAKALAGAHAQSIASACADVFDFCRITASSCLHL